MYVPTAIWIYTTCLKSIKTFFCALQFSDLPPFLLETEMFPHSCLPGKGQCGGSSDVPEATVLWHFLKKTPAECRHSLGVSKKKRKNLNTPPALWIKGRLLILALFLYIDEHESPLLWISSLRALGHSAVPRTQSYQ